MTTFEQRMKKCLGLESPHYVYAVQFYEKPSVGRYDENRFGSFMEEFHPNGLVERIQKEFAKPAEFQRACWRISGKSIQFLLDYCSSDSALASSFRTVPTDSREVVERKDDLRYARLDVAEWWVWNCVKLLNCNDVDYGFGIDRHSLIELLCELNLKKDNGDDLTPFALKLQVALEVFVLQGFTERQSERLDVLEMINNMKESRKKKAFRLLWEGKIQSKREFKEKCGKPISDCINRLIKNEDKVLRDWLRGQQKILK